MTEQNERELLMWLKKIHEELFEMNARFSELTVLAKETKDDGRSWEKTGTALRIVESYQV